jgi:4-diphosphocytidyl-2-C-methyl-D-erythritol kinase
LRKDARAMKLRAPAKVNLQLKICGRRADGFHDIETLLAPISLADELSVEISDGTAATISCDDPNVPGAPDNLAAKAANEYARHTGRRFGLQISIRKRIPIGAGLGGGSSDAAAVLLALDRVFDTKLGPPELEKLAAKVGSDVPFFIRGQSAICRGRGEIIQPFELPEPLSLLLLKPPFGVETSWAYQSWSTSRAICEAAQEEQDLGSVKIFNFLERPVFEKFLLLPVMKDWLRRQPEVRAAAMSGSGSAIFAVLKEDVCGQELEQRLKANFGETLWTAFCQAPA